MTPPNAGPNEAMDLCLALFVNVYHLRNWILGTDPTLRSAVDKYVQESQALGLARDLCNGAKHLTLTRASVDARFLTAVEYVPPPLKGPNTGPTYRLLMLTDRGKVDMASLADTCIESWRVFMAAHGLWMPTPQRREGS